MNIQLMTNLYEYSEYSHNIDVYSLIVSVVLSQQQENTKNKINSQVMVFPTHESGHENK